MGSDFDASTYGLKRVSIDNIHGLLFICFTDSPLSLEGCKKDLAESMAMFDMPKPSEYFALQALSVSKRIMTTSFRMQTTLDLARIAIALERHHLAEGRYPTALAELSPTLVAKIPHDRMNGEPLHYSIKPTGTPQLYSIGFNGVDNQGEVMKGFE